MIFALSIIASYLIGSIPSAVWVGKIVRGIDVREHGSGNMGAANTARVLGLRWGMVAGLIDVAKGFAPVFWLGQFAADSSPVSLPDTQVLFGVIAVLGHLFPLFAGFRGGKGILTAVGVFAAILPFDLAVAIVVWGVIFGATRIVSVASLTGTAALAASVLVRRFVLDFPIPIAFVSTALLLAALVFYTHRSNLRRLRTGDENRFDRK